MFSVSSLIYQSFAAWWGIYSAVTNPQHMSNILYISRYVYISTYLHIYLVKWKVEIEYFIRYLWFYDCIGLERGRVLHCCGQRVLTLTILTNEELPPECHHYSSRYYRYIIDTLTALTALMMFQLPSLTQGMLSYVVPWCHCIKTQYHVS